MPVRDPYGYQVIRPYEYSSIQLYGVECQDIQLSEYPGIVTPKRGSYPAVYLRTSCQIWLQQDNEQTEILFIVKCVLYNYVNLLSKFYSHCVFLRRLSIRLKNCDTLWHVMREINIGNCELFRLFMQLVAVKLSTKMFLH